MVNGNNYKRGLRNGREEATIENVREDIAELKKMLTTMGDKYSEYRSWAKVNSATITLLTIAVGFLYMALVRGWF